jgi:hypothetical protein
MRKIAAICGFIFVLCACGGNFKGKQDFGRDIIIAEDSLVLIIKDMHIMDAAAKQNLAPNNSDNQAKYEQYKAVFDKHHVSKMRFDSTINLYTKHGKKFDALYDKVIDVLEKEEEAQSAQ